LTMEESDRRKQREAFRAWRPGQVDSLILDAPRKQQHLPGESVGSLVSLEVRATNRGTVDHRAGLSLSLAEPGPAEAFYASDATLGVRPKAGWAAAPSADSVRAWSDLPGGPWQRRVDWKLEPGGTRVARMVLACYPCPSSELLSWARAPHRERADQARAFWRGEAERGALLRLGDPEVENAVRAARVVLLSCRERRGGHEIPLGNPFQYRDVWVRDGARVAQALVLHGYVPEARQIVRGFRELQWPHGPFLSQRGQLDGTGQALWAYEQVLLRPWRDVDVDRYAGDAWRAWRWYERLRERRQRPGDPLSAMLPAGDPKDNELVRAQLVGNDAWAIAGYRAAARLLFAAGRGEDSRRVEKSRRAYVDDFARALAAVGARDIPPSWQGSGRDWGNLAAAYPCNALSPCDPHADALAARYWARAGGAGLGYYGTPDTLHGYVGADLGTWALLRGRPGAADSVLSALLYWRDSSGGAAELFDRRGRDYGVNLPPHATAAAAFLTLVRNSLIEDDTDTLRLTLGARRRWWASGTVRHAPTRWGLLDLDFHLRGGVAEWRWSPVPVWTELALPPGSVPAGRLDWRLRPGSLPGTVLAPPGTDGAKVAVRETGAPLAAAEGSRGR